MFERFTDRARRVVVLARQEARLLDHDHVGTEHILLGLLAEGEGVGVKALVALGIDLPDMRQQVEGLIGRGPKAPSGQIPFTGPAKHVLELSLREALQFGHNYIGTEHLLLGLIREDDGVAARVLAGVGADAGNVRLEIIQLLHGYSAAHSAQSGQSGAAQSQAAQSQAGQPGQTRPGQGQSRPGQSRQAIASALTGRGRRIDQIHQGIEAIGVRLTAIEDALGLPSAPVPESLRELGRRIAVVRREKEDALDAKQFEQAAQLREQEKQLIRRREVAEEIWLAESGRGQRLAGGAGAGASTAGGGASSAGRGSGGVAEAEAGGRSSIEANRKLWNETSGDYQAKHDPQIGAAPRLWGMFSIPDSELHALGDVTGQRVLELGCGAGQWSRGLVGEAGAVVGFDLSEAQLGAARQAMGATRYPLVQGAAQQLPFADASFDVVFCDHGGLSWAPPQVAVPEAARVLRSGGRLVFNVFGPLAEVCYDETADRVDTRLHQGYFDLGVVAEDHGASSYQLTYGGWIAVLRAAGLNIEALIEPRPGPDARSSYLRSEPPGWASSWPTEMLWVASKP